MEDILVMVEGLSTSEITSFDQTDLTIFLKNYCSVCEFYEISREEYMNKNNNEKNH